VPSLPAQDELAKGIRGYGNSIVWCRRKLDRWFGFRRRPRPRRKGRHEPGSRCRPCSLR